MLAYFFLCTCWVHCGKTQNCNSPPLHQRWFIQRIKAICTSHREIDFSSERDEKESVWKTVFRQWLHYKAESNYLALTHRLGLPLLLSQERARPILPPAEVQQRIFMTFLGWLQRREAVIPVCLQQKETERYHCIQSKCLFRPLIEIQSELSDGKLPALGTSFRPSINMCLQILSQFCCMQINLNSRIF